MCPVCVRFYLAESRRDCKGQSEALVAVFCGWGNAGEVRRGKCIRATALRKNTYFSTIQERALNCPDLWQ